MGKKSEYDLTNAQHVLVPISIWEPYVKEFGKEEAPEKIRDDLELCIGAERKENNE